MVSRTTIFRRLLAYFPVRNNLFAQQNVVFTAFQKQFSNYEAVHIFRTELFKKNYTMGNFAVDKVRLQNIVNLHNREGVRQLEVVNQMKRDIDRGKHILQNDGLPNVKMVHSKNRGWVLFDGHHTVLAYMSAGIRTLAELPFVAISEFNVPIPNSEMNEFFWRTRC